MTLEDRNRMARQDIRRKGRPPKHEPQAPVVVEVVTASEVVKCPWCGAARLGQWDVLAGTQAIGKRKQCKVCRHVYAFQPDGMVRLVR